MDDVQNPVQDASKKTAETSFDVSNNLTYSTTAPDLGEPLKGAVFLEEVNDNSQTLNAPASADTVLGPDRKSVV